MRKIEKPITVVDDDLFMKADNKKAKPSFDKRLEKRN